MLLREHSHSLSNCVSIDLEVGKENHRIHAFAAIRADTDQRVLYRGGDLHKAIRKLDELSADVSLILGHNVIDFDLLHLRKADPNLRLLQKPVIDTLRLGPLAFPRNPYHHLVKHYKDAQLLRVERNDPEIDAQLTLDVFKEQRDAFEGAGPNLLIAWHWLTTIQRESEGFNAFFTDVRQARRPAETEASVAIQRLLKNAACVTHLESVISDVERTGWALAYALAWISVSGGNSVVPPWVLSQFPETSDLIRKLRDTRCDNAVCQWCSEKHDARKELKRWFGYENYRPKPLAKNDKSMQQTIVECSMARKHVLGILPTGTGKSICYQVPALFRYEKLGSLTVVISPLVALMEDQVKGLVRQNINSCVAINGMLTMPERADALDKVRLGNAAILLISPEQLRNGAVRRVLDQREIGGWVLDEAHCISKWGHDFRPDYRYVVRFIRESAGDGPIPPVLCLTATAKPDVVQEIRDLFKDRLGIDLEAFDGGARRPNLSFEVIPTTGGRKLADIDLVLEERWPENKAGGAIVYCATRKYAEDVTEYLQSQDVSADFFHAGLEPERKKDVQGQFIDGELKVIVATNAFGMGIDKPDVRLVLHADIPGSLENYLQEAGRAGRDQQFARCVLMYSTDDVEKQFSMTARSRLTQPEIQGILKALRNLDRRDRAKGEVVATPWEVLLGDIDHDFQRDKFTDDTRVVTAISWLEEAHLLNREENRTQVLPSSLRVHSVEAAREKIRLCSSIPDKRQRELMAIVHALMEATADEGISTDDLMSRTGLSFEGVRDAMYNLDSLGIVSNDTALTAFVHKGVQDSSQARFNQAQEMEIALIAHMRRLAPDMNIGESSSLFLRRAAQSLRDQGIENPLPEKIWRIVSSIANDGRSEGEVASWSVRRRDAESVYIKLQRRWGSLEEVAELRRSAAKRLLDHLLASIPENTTKGKDLLATTTLGKLARAVENDVLPKQSDVRSPRKLTDRALMWLHEQEVIRLNHGLAVFRRAMTIQMKRTNQRFSHTDYRPLEFYYQGQVLQIHVMEEYANRGLAKATEAIRLAMDYFNLSREDFLARWLPNRGKELERETTPESWQKIVEDLKNRDQTNIVADDRKNQNVLVLAGPGSGKTRVLVHRIAYLIRVRRERPQSILALTYNRHAAVEVRSRLAELIGNDARGVMVMTCHALAMRLAGFTFAKRVERPDDEAFEDVLRTAIDLLNGKGLLPEDADEQRDRLLKGFRWILVDEYQDIDSVQYGLISALAGRTLNDPDSKLNLFAVGDDDQNVYAFSGASVEFIQRFEQDYKAQKLFLTENYRSTRHIVAASNAVIDLARERMKGSNSIQVNRDRDKDPHGGKWEGMDPVGKGKVRILPKGDEITQVLYAMDELQRMSEISSDWDWSRCAVIARKWKYLNPVRAYCEVHQIPALMAHEEVPNFWQLRETQDLVQWLSERNGKFVTAGELNERLSRGERNPWNDLLEEVLEGLRLETGGGKVSVECVIEWLAETRKDTRQKQNGMLLLTAHRAKGLEFDHVVVLDGGWNGTRRDRDPDEHRRLFYVAMTRARENLVFTRLRNNRHRFLDSLRGHGSVLHLQETNLPPPPKGIEYRYLNLTLKDVDLSFAGRKSSNDAIHQAIKELSPGKSLNIRDTTNPMELHNGDGVTVCRLSKKFNPPDDMRCREAKILAIIVRKREGVEAEGEEGASPVLLVCVGVEDREGVLIVAVVKMVSLTHELTSISGERREG